MKTKKPVIYFLSLLLISLLYLPYGCNEPKLKSKWRDRDILIDGVDKEWEDCRLYYDNDTRTSIGLFNDKDDLYVNFSTSDRMIQRQIIEQGFTVWLDSTGGKDKHLGIFYPTGIMDRQMPGNEEFGKNRHTGDRNPEDGNKHGHPEDDDIDDKGFRDRDAQSPSILLDDMLDDMPDVIDIKISDGSGDWDTLFLEEKNTSGIRAKVKHIQGRLVYELKIPILQNDQSPYGIVVPKRGKIGVGFETTGMKAPYGESRGPMGGGMGGPSQDGGMGRPEGGMGRPGGREGMGRPGERGPKGSGFKKHQVKPLELWAKVFLASQP